MTDHRASPWADARDPIADSSDYRFAYRYDCSAGARAPVFEDDLEEE